MIYNLQFLHNITYDCLFEFEWHFDCNVTFLITIKTSTDVNKQILFHSILS